MLFSLLPITYYQVDMFIYSSTTSQCNEYGRPLMYDFVTCLQTPHDSGHSLNYSAGSESHSIHLSIRLLLQIAQVSTFMFQPE